MAASSIFHGGQTVMTCQLCEETNEIKWKCMTCEFLMCVKCCKIHRKVKSTGDHDIIDIKDITVQKDFSKIKCRTHDGQICCLFCQECTEVVCPLCIASTHNKHNMGAISEGYTFSVKSLKEMSFTLDREYKDLAQDASTLESARSAEKKKYETGKQNILHQDKAVKDAVDQHTKKLLGDLDEKSDIVQKSITAEETKIAQRTTDIEEKKRSIDQALASEKVDIVLNIANKDVEIGERRPVNFKETLPSFFPREITQAKIKSLYGDFQNCAEVKVEDEIKLSVEDTYVCSYDYPFPQNLLSCADGSLWISHCDSNILQHLIEFQSGDKYNSKTYKLKVLYMACTPNGDLLLSTGKSELRIIPKTTGQIKKSNFCAGPDLVTYGVHVTRNNKILLAAQVVALNYLANVHVTGQVIKMNMDGITERVYSVDNDNKPLFYFPRRITTDSKNNFYIIDMISEDEKARIVILNKWGSVKGIYEGHPVINKDMTFSPLDFVVTKTDILIVADYKCHGLHVLNNEGQCIAYKDVSEIGIQYPGSLDIDNRGSLLIGTLGNESNSAKIYTVQFSGF